MNGSASHSEHDELLTAAEVAALLKCSRSQVYALHSSRALPARWKIFETAKGWRWSRLDVLQFVDASAIECAVTSAARAPIGKYRREEVDTKLKLVARGT